jgi:hypothetical protein
MSLTNRDIRNRYNETHTDDWKEISIEKCFIFAFEQYGDEGVEIVAQHQCWDFDMLWISPSSPEFKLCQCVEKKLYERFKK